MSSAHTKTGAVGIPVLQGGEDVNLDNQTLEAASAAGQLLIRAAATLGTLSPEQQSQLAQASALPALLAASLRSSEQLCTDVRRSLKAHPPQGFQAPV